VGFLRRSGQMSQALSGIRSIEIIEAIELAALHRIAS
jgi:hypothetical protein